MPEVGVAVEGVLCEYPEIPPEPAERFLLLVGGGITPLGTCRGLGPSNPSFCLRVGP